MSSFASGSTTRTYEITTSSMSDDKKNPSQGRCGETIVLPMSLEGAITKCSVCDPDGWVRLERSLSGNWA